MTRRTAGSVLALAGALAVCAAGLAAGRLADARALADASRRRAEALTRDAAEVESLRSAAARLAEGDGPTADAIPLITAALTEAGLPQDRLREVSALGATGGAARLRVRAVVEPVRLDDVGRLLDVLRRAQRVWTPVQIELAGRRGGEFRAVLVLSAAGAGGAGGGPPVNQEAKP